MEVVTIAAFVVFSVSIAIMQIKSHKKRIAEQIHSMGGEVINIERKALATGPFLVVRRGRTVYKIEYTAGGQVKEGWVKFGDLSGPDWKL